MNRTALVAAALLVAGCEKPSTDCVLHLELADAGHDVSAPPLAGVEATFRQQLLSGGVLTSAFTPVAEGATDAQGVCDLAFAKENALAYRLDLEADGFFARQIPWNPDDFLPGETLPCASDLMPRATVRVRLEAGLLASPGDVLQFRTLHVPGEYPTCDNGWRTFNSATAADTAWVCDMEGGATVAYTWKVTRDGETVNHVDSIVAERFVESTIHVVW